MNNYHNQSESEPVEQVVIVSVNGEEKEFFGDELTSALSEAALYLQELAKKEVEF